MAWIPKIFEEAILRAAGRRRYHAQRREGQRQRQRIVMAALVQLNFRTYGAGRTLAQRLSVSTATISRDIAYLQQWRIKLAGLFDEETGDRIFRKFVAEQTHPADKYVITIRNGVLR